VFFGLAVSESVGCVPASRHQRAWVDHPQAVWSRYRRRAAHRPRPTARRSRAGRTLGRDLDSARRVTGVHRRAGHRTSSCGYLLVLGRHTEQPTYEFDAACRTEDTSDPETVDRSPRNSGTMPGKRFHLEPATRPRMAIRLVRATHAGFSSRSSRRRADIPPGWRTGRFPITQ
jgi:hypothetical protein